MMLNNKSCFRFCEIFFFFLSSEGRQLIQPVDVFALLSVVSIQGNKFSEIIRKTAFFQKGEERVSKRFFKFENTRTFIRDGEFVTEFAVEVESGVFRNGAVHHSDLFNDEFTADDCHVDEHGGLVSASVDQNGEGLRGSTVFVASVAGGSSGARGAKLAVEVKCFVTEALLGDEVVGAEGVADVPTSGDLRFGFSGVGFFTLNFGECLIVKCGTSRRETFGSEDEGSCC